MKLRAAVVSQLRRAAPSDAGDDPLLPAAAADAAHKLDIIKRIGARHPDHGLNRFATMVIALGKLSKWRAHRSDAVLMQTIACIADDGHCGNVATLMLSKRSNAMASLRASCKLDKAGQRLLKRVVFCSTKLTDGSGPAVCVLLSAVRAAIASLTQANSILGKARLELELADAEELEAEPSADADAFREDPFDVDGCSTYQSAMGEYTLEDTETENCGSHRHPLGPVRPRPSPASTPSLHKPSAGTDATLIPNGYLLVSAAG